MSLVQLVYSGKVDSTKEQQLQRLCAKVTSTVDLAGARVKVALSTARTRFLQCRAKQHLWICCNGML